MLSVGQQLQQAREARSMSIEDVVQATRIPRGSVVAIEEDRLEDLPAPVFVRGFVRAYAGAVGLDGTELLRDLRVFVAPTPVETMAPNMELGGSRQATGLPPYAPLFGESSGPGMSIGLSHAVLIVLAAGMFLAAWLMAGLDNDRSAETAGSGAPAIQESVDGVSGYTRVDAGH
jgi:cytoskeletal protein RodZ